MVNTAFGKFNLTGKTALITGAAGLLGQQHAAALLESGATVVLTDISPEALAAVRTALSCESTTSRILTRVMDVSRAASVTSVAEELANRRIDILVNNAAIDPKVSADAGVQERKTAE